MPRSSFGLGVLNAASPGLSKLAAALGGGGQAYQQGYDAEAGGQSKMAAALAQAAHHNAQAQFEQAKTGVLSRRPDVYREQVAAASGTSSPVVDAIRKGLSTGQIPMREVPGPTETGAPLTAEIPPEQVSKVTQMLQQFLPLITNAGDLQPDQMAHAAERFRQMGLSDQVIADPTRAAAVFKGQAAADAKPLFHADSSGAVLDLGGGQLDTTNPMAGSTIAHRTQQAAQAKAGAAENYAQANAATALAGLRKTQAGAVGAGPGRVPVGYRYTSDPDTGALKLEPIPGGPKDPNAQTGKPLPGSVSKGLLENQANLRRAESALALVEGKSVGGAAGDTQATGWKGFLPNGVLNRVDPSGVNTRAAIADLGSLIIHDRSGAAVTAAEFPRLAPFIPGATDDAATVKKKLQNFVRVYEQTVGEQVDFYRASGFNVPAEKLRGAQVDAPAPAAPGTGFTYLGKE